MGDRFEGSAADYVERLAGLGWFEGLPTTARRTILTRVDRALAGRRDLDDSDDPADLDEEDALPARGVATVSIALDCLNYHEYPDLLRAFSRGSFGLFQPEEVSEAVEGARSERIRVTFVHDGAEYEFEAENRKWVDEAALLTVIHAALDEACHAVRFARLGDPADCQARYALTTPAAFEAALAAGLLAL